MMRFATRSDIPGMKTLWAMSFDDELNYVDFFYDKISSPEDTVVFEMDGVIAAMLTLIPTEFVYNGQSVRAAYIYGAATHKKYRRHGAMTTLLKFAEEQSLARGYSLCILVPGERYLFDYYKRRGYRADFCCRNVVLKHGMLDNSVRPEVPVTTDTLTAAQIYELREQCLAPMPYIRWNEHQLENILLDAAAYGEHIESYDGEFGRAYLICRERNRDMYIRECLGTDDKAQLALIAGVVEKYDPASVTIQFPLKSDMFKFEGERRLYGMAKPLVTKVRFHDIDAYMNLMLD